jgi:hypothetical protein
MEICKLLVLHDVVLTEEHFERGYNPELFTNAVSLTDLFF